jgi:hypothetical protein
LGMMIQTGKERGGVGKGSGGLGSKLAYDVKTPPWSVFISFVSV